MANEKYGNKMTGTTSFQAILTTKLNISMIDIKKTKSNVGMIFFLLCTYRKVPNCPVDFARLLRGGDVAPFTRPVLL